MNSFKMIYWTFVLAMIAVFAASEGFAGNAGDSAGLSLMRSVSPRASALGETMGTVEDDVAAMIFNPATLSTLGSTQASFLYDRGIADDGYGRFMIGGPRAGGGLGMSISYYDGGTLDAFDGVRQRSVTAQRDFSLSAAMARRVGRISLGGAIRYFSSNVADEVSGNAVALGAGCVPAEPGNPHSLWQWLVRSAARPSWRNHLSNSGVAMASNARIRGAGALD
jgi:hypothetical protein